MAGLARSRTRGTISRAVTRSADQFATQQLWLPAVPSGLNLQTTRSLLRAVQLQVCHQGVYRKCSRLARVSVQGQRSRYAGPCSTCWLTWSTCCRSRSRCGSLRKRGGRGTPQISWSLSWMRPGRQGCCGRGCSARATARSNRAESGRRQLGAGPLRPGRRGVALPCMVGLTVGVCLRPVTWRVCRPPARKTKCPSRPARWFHRAARHRCTSRAASSRW